MNSLIFFGSDQYSEVVLNNLLSSPVALIVTDRPKPKGRDQITEPNPVEKLALKHHLKVTYYPDNSEEMSKLVKSLSTTESVGLCASFDHLLPPTLITFFKGNLFNLHPSLLPQYRNVSPVQYAIALGDKETGITLFKISTGIDNGEIVAQLQESILSSDTTPTLTSRLFSLGTTLFLKELQSSVPCKNNKFPYLVKPAHPLVFTKRLTRGSGFVEWDSLHQLLLNNPIDSPQTTNELLKLRLEKTLPTDSPSLILFDLIRALNPWPSVWSTINTKKAAGPEHVEGGEIRLSVQNNPTSHSEFLLHLAGKPKPITLSDFTKYYLKP